MFDTSLRALKDAPFHPIIRVLPSAITPNHITAAAFLSGIACIYSLSTCHPLAALCFWAGNRILDCLDGCLARSRGASSQVGGFLDLLGDMIIYSMVPIGGLMGRRQEYLLSSEWMSVAALEASFYINGFVLFYSAAVLAVEKENAKQGRFIRAKALTAVEMPPALMEGLESGVCFTCMILWPDRVVGISWIMAAGVVVTIMQRALWVIRMLMTVDNL